MKSGSTQFFPTGKMGFCDPLHQMAMWGDYKANTFVDSSLPTLLNFEQNHDNKSEETSLGTAGASHKYDQGQKKPEKVLRRLAQNREAARKSRLRKKAYVQQLEACKQRLVQLQQEIDQARQQGVYTGGSCDVAQNACPGTVIQSVGTFEAAYGRWLEEQNRLISELRNALHSNIGDVELAVYVDNGLRHYFDLFSMKASAAKVDAFYIMSGLWISLGERFFFWIGGFRPSEILKILLPHLEPMSDEQRFDIFNLQQSCQQAEDALSRGMEKLQQIAADTLTGGQLGDGNYFHEVTAAMEKLEVVVRFVVQADNLRQGTLQQISCILSTRQAARGLLALGDYTQRLQALSSAWSKRHSDASSTAPPF